MDANNHPIKPQSLPDATEHPGRKPLARADIESFLMGIARGQSQRAAYHEFISSNCSNQTAEQQASRIVNRPECKSRLAYIKFSASRLQSHLSRDDLRKVLEVIVNQGRDGDKLLATKQLRDFDDEDKRIQDAQSNLDPAMIAARLGQYEGAPATAEHLRAVIERLVALLNVSLAEVVQACADRDSAPPSEPSVAKPITINTLQQVDSSNPAKS